MKDIVDYYRRKGILFYSLKQILPKEIGSRKRVEIYLGVDSKRYYILLLAVEKKSRILKKEAKELMEFHDKIEKHIDSRITKKIILINAPLCSKAKLLMEENGWRVDITD